MNKIYTERLSAILLTNFFLLQMFKTLASCFHTTGARQKKQVIPHQKRHQFIFLTFHTFCNSLQNISRKKQQNLSINEHNAFFHLEFYFFFVYTVRFSSKNWFTCFFTI